MVFFPKIYLFQAPAARKQRPVVDNPQPMAENSKGRDIGIYQMHQDDGNYQHTDNARDQALLMPADEFRACNLIDPVFVKIDDLVQ